MIPRNEYPNPQWERKTWRCLNGVWQFDIDYGKTAIERKVYENDLKKEILVPFCPESVLSGIGNLDFMPAVMYKRQIMLSEEEIAGRVMLHFGAVDFETSVYVNNVFAGTHKGGYAHFEFDITDYVTDGENSIFVYVLDDPRNGIYCGKQSVDYYSKECSYSRVTGIWQSVWLEFVPRNYIKSAKYYTDIKNGTITITGTTIGRGDITISASYNNKAMGEKTVYSSGSFCTTIELQETYLWELGKGRLYDLKFEMGDDTVYSYFGLRNTYIDGMKFMLNDKSVFQRTVLDQGYYREGIYTAKDETELVRDIELSMALGFNGARLHQKVFEPRFLYHCDKMGYMVWGEQANWRMDYANSDIVEMFNREWVEIIERDFNHPSIIGWCPYNETWEYVEAENKNRILSTIYYLTKSLDSTRPCIDTSGFYHVITDIYDIHDYKQNPEELASYLAGIENGAFGEKFGEPVPGKKAKQIYKEGQPVFVSEYGGMRWSVSENSWGYGTAPKSEQEFIERYKGLTETLLNNANIMGFCYTQLYDVEQECNGLYDYDRNPKFDMSVFKTINSKKAAIEETS